MPEPVQDRGPIVNEPTAFVALLRGVNVGKAKRVPMAALRELLAGLGYTGVATLLNSGNAVFRATQGTPALLAADIQKAIASKLGVEVPVIVKSAKDLAAIAAANTLAAAALDPSRLLIVFVQDRKALAALALIGLLVEAPAQFVIGADAAYLDCPGGILESRAAKALLGSADSPATTRNWATVLKLLALARDCDP
jgi:uncharacterized protein (DUF1697 family)